MLPVDYHTQVPDQRNSGMDHIDGFSIVQAE